MNRAQKVYEINPRYHRLHLYQDGSCFIIAGLSATSNSTDNQGPGKKSPNKKLPNHSPSVETASTSEVVPYCPRRRGVGGDIDEKIRIVRRRCNQKVQLALSEDRLLEDKMYLKALALGIEGKPGSDIDMVSKWTGAEYEPQIFSAEI